MAMLADMLKSVLEANKAPSGGKTGDEYIEKPPAILENDGKAVGNYWNLKDLLGMNDPEGAAAITGDDGMISTNQKNPFLEAIQKSRANNNTGPGVLRQLLGSVLGGTMVPGTGTVGGDPAGIASPTHTPGTRQDAALNPTPMKDQSQPNFAKPDYSQPSALDPNAIEELRLSLLTDSGQLDPNNPNGLSGRMSDPNSQVDMQNQRRESQTIEDSVRGFDGSRKANIAKGNQ